MGYADELKKHFEAGFTAHWKNEREDVAETLRGGGAEAPPEDEKYGAEFAQKVMADGLGRRVEEACVLTIDAMMKVIQRWPDEITRGIRGYQWPKVLELLLRDREDALFYRKQLDVVAAQNAKLFDELRALKAENEMLVRARKAGAPRLPEKAFEHLIPKGTNKKNDGDGKPKLTEDRFKAGWTLPAQMSQYDSVAAEPVQEQWGEEFEAF